MFTILRPFTDPKPGFGNVIPQMVLGTASILVPVQSQPPHVVLQPKTQLNLHFPLLIGLINVLSHVTVVVVLPVVGVGRVPVELQLFLWASVVIGGIGVVVGRHPPLGRSMVVVLAVPFSVIVAVVVVPV